MIAIRGNSARAPLLPDTCGLHNACWLHPSAHRGIHSFEACSSSLPILRRHNLLNAAFLPVFSVIIPSPTLAGCSNWSLSLSFRTKLAFFPFSNRATQTETPRTLFLFSCSRAFHRLVMTKKDYKYRLECDEDYVRQFVIRKKPHSPRIVTTLLSLSHDVPEQNSSPWEKLHAIS